MRKKFKQACGVAKAASIRNSAGKMRAKQDRRAKDARRHWSRDVEA